MQIGFTVLQNLMTCRSIKHIGSRATKCKLSHRNKTGIAGHCVGIWEDLNE